MLARVQAEKEAKQPPDAPAAVTMASPTAAKIALFRSLFRGREDVLPRRWENPKTGKAGYAPMYRNEWVRGVCGKPQVRCIECPNQAFIPIGDDILRSHLYPMLPDETYWFLAADFDKKSWMQDVAAFRDATRTKGVPVAIERSRSGNVRMPGFSSPNRCQRRMPDVSVRFWLRRRWIAAPISVSIHMIGSCRARTRCRQVVSVI